MSNNAQKDDGGYMFDRQTLQQRALELLTADKPTFTDEEFREVVRHLHLLVKELGVWLESPQDTGPSLGLASAFEDSKNLLQRKGFTLDQSDLV